jgi:hypothetical protein
VFAFQVHSKLPMESAADLLQLALNCSNTTAAATAVSHLQLKAASAARYKRKLLVPDVARRLLVTAATRQHTAAVERMVRLAYMQQQIDAATLEAMLAELLKHDGVLRELVRLPAAAHLSSDAVIRLLLAAAARQGYSTPCDNVHMLLQLPAARQFDSAAVLQLLQAAIQQGRMPQPFCRLPGAQQLSSGEVFQLLQAAVQLGMRSTSDLQRLCKMPGAQHLDSAAVFQLLQAALQGIWGTFITRCLCELPAARQLDSQAVQQLLQAAVRRGLDTSHICELPAAQELDRQTVLQLFQAAAQHGSSVYGLFDVPAAQQLTSQHVLQLLEVAAQRGSTGSTRLLCQLPAAKQLSKKEVAGLPCRQPSRLAALWAVHVQQRCMGCLVLAAARRGLT